MDKFIRVDDYLAPETWTGLLGFFERSVRWSYGWQFRT
jgi:hypothetical protein